MSDPQTLDLIRPSYEVIGIMVGVTAMFGYGMTWWIRSWWQQADRSKFVLRTISIVSGVGGGIVLGTLLNGQGGGVQWGAILGVIGGSLSTVAVAIKHALVKRAERFSGAPTNGAKDRGENEPRITPGTDML